MIPAPTHLHATPLPALDEQLHRCWHALERRRVWARLKQLWQREHGEALDEARRAS